MTIQKQSQNVVETEELRLTTVKSKALVNKQQAYIAIKRTADIVAATVGLIILSPVLILIAVLIKIDSTGSAMIAQTRIGKDGKTFKLYKYRTMIENADKVLEELLEKDEELKKEYNTYKKLKNDVRITKVGKILRKTSLDEIPQLINVLKGEMSLVGPRPYLPREKEDMGMYYGYIIKEKPGITGYWQVSGRSDVTFDERLKMEKYYAENSSIGLDCEIFIKTFAVALNRSGAI